MFLTTILAVIATTRCIAASLVCNITNGTSVGPENGHLVIVGGNLQSASIYERIIALAGGPDAPIVVVPTAGGEPTYSTNFSTAVAFRRLGATNVTVLHTYDPAVADTNDFIAPLLEAKGIFFGGGRQWRLVDAYAGTKSEKAFHAVLDRGGVISGSSAGASIIGSFLARGDTANNQVMIGDHTVGFGYMKNTAIDQHVLVRNRHFDMFDILREYPELLGLAIDEDTAIVVHKNEAEVIGDTYALVYDGGFWSREGSESKNLPPSNALFYFLRPGDKYDLGARKVIVTNSTGGGDE
jgi:cyanophycinase